MWQQSSIRAATRAAILLLASGLIASAQQNSCQEFRALSQMTFDNNFGTYVGPTFASLGDEVLIDAGSARPAVRPPVTTCNDGMCTDRDAQYLYDFGDGNTITLEVQIAFYKQPPTFATYRGTNRIVAGTGRFKGASGVLVESGPFFAWIDEQGQLQARYSGGLSGRICGVEPNNRSRRRP